MEQKNQNSANELRLEGTWVMDSAFEILKDGSCVTIYGKKPQGRLMVDREGRYSLQIFRRVRARFASGVKAKGTLEEYKDAVLGSSTHTGQVQIDPVKQQLIFKVETASYPNWEGQTQVRNFTYEDGLLHYQVPAEASGNGTVAHSLWRKL